MSLNLYYPGRESKANWVMDSLAEGWPDTRAVYNYEYDGNPGAYWGLLGQTRANIERHIREQTPFYFTDMPYWHRWMGLDTELYYWRVIPNALHVNWVDPKASMDRFEKLNVDVKPWRTGGDYILLCPSSEAMTQFYTGMRADRWVRQMIHDIDEYTKMPVYVREKPRMNKTSGPRAAGENTFERAVENAYCVVTLVSMAAVEAACLGVPVICDPHSPAAPVGNALGSINKLHTPDREQWLATLANHQFTEQEIAQGEAYRILEC